MIKEAILSTVWMGYGDDGILRIRMLENALVDLDNIRLQYETIARLVGDKRVPVLLDARADFNTTREAQEYLAMKSDGRIATAVLTNNPVSRALINTYITVFRPVSPYKMFTEEDKAVGWLKEMLEKEENKSGV
jgi:hypothetical protein